MKCHFGIWSFLPRKLFGSGPALAGWPQRYFSRKKKRKKKLAGWLGPGSGSPVGRGRRCDWCAPGGGPPTGGAGRAGTGTTERRHARRAADRNAPIGVSTFNFFGFFKKILSVLFFYFFQILIFYSFYFLFLFFLIFRISRM